MARNRKLAAQERGFGTGRRCGVANCDRETNEEKGEGRNSKGCDIGYALAANSCEGVNNVDACTVTAFDATTAFAVPDPNLPLAGPVGFFGSGCSLDRSTEPGHSVYFGSATVYFD
jgi:hypothetical protein